MNDVVLENFFEKLDDKNYKLALGMRDMVNGFPEYLAQRMVAHLEKQQAEKLEECEVWGKHKKTNLNVDFYVGNTLHAIDIYCRERSYRLEFFLRSRKELPNKALEKVGEKESWRCNEQNICAREFPFDNPQEGENRVNEYLDEFFSKLFAKAEE